MMNANRAKIDFMVDLPTEEEASSSTTTTTSTTIAFGSCHKNKYANPLIWKNIIRNSNHNNSTGTNENPITAFLWTGDAIYPPVRNIASTSQLQYEYQQMKTNHTAIGYTQLFDSSYKNSSSSTPYIFGTWDDHDYGGNDRGGGNDNEMPQRRERARLFYQFINQSIPMDDAVTSDNNNDDDDNDKTNSKTEREGVYYSVEFRRRTTSKNTPNDEVDENEPTNSNSNSNSSTTQTIRILFLDTRYYRTSHCLPSMAGRFPLGAGIACLSRWCSAGLLQQYCSSKMYNDSTILGTTQWEWLRQQIYDLPPPDILMVVSSIQVYTTNPAMESWGHYPHELRQLSEYLLYAATRRHSGSVVTILSGDVHHGEILNPFPPIHPISSSSSSSEEPYYYYLEVTSSGLTHDCSKHIYGIVCEPLLRTFHQHRHINKNNYYIGQNYGTINIDWIHQKVSINVHDALTGMIQLSTGSRSFGVSQHLHHHHSIDTNENTTLLLLNSIIPCMDNHLVPYVYQGCMWIVLLLTTIILLYRYTSFRSFRHKGTTRTAQPDNNINLGEKKKKS